MAGPNFNTDVTIVKTAPKLTFGDDSASPTKSWNVQASQSSWTVSADLATPGIVVGPKNLTSGETQVGIGNISASLFGPNQLTIKSNSTCIGLINGDEASYFDLDQGALATIFCQPYIRGGRLGGLKYRGLSLGPRFNGDGTIDVVATEVLYNGGLSTWFIVGVSTGSDWFEVETNLEHRFPSGMVFQVTGSTGNNGQWTVSTVSYTGGTTDRTRITVTGNITNGTANGTITLWPILALNQGSKWFEISTDAHSVQYR